MRRGEAATAPPLAESNPERRGTMERICADPPEAAQRPSGYAIALLPRILVRVVRRDRTDVAGGGRLARRGGACARCLAGVAVAGLRSGSRGRGRPVAGSGGIARGRPSVHGRAEVRREGIARFRGRRGEDDREDARGDEEEYGEQQEPEPYAEADHVGARAAVLLDGVVPVVDFAEVAEPEDGVDSRRDQGNAARHEEEGGRHPAIVQEQGGEGSGRGDRGDEDQYEARVFECVCHVGEGGRLLLPARCRQVGQEEDEQTEDDPRPEEAGDEEPLVVRQARAVRPERDSRARRREPGGRLLGELRLPERLTLRHALRRVVITHVTQHIRAGCHGGRAACDRTPLSVTGLPLAPLPRGRRSAAPRSLRGGRTAERRASIPTRPRCPPATRAVVRIPHAGGRKSVNSTTNGWRTR